MFELYAFSVTVGALLQLHAHTTVALSAIYGLFVGILLRFRTTVILSIGACFAVGTLFLQYANNQQQPQGGFKTVTARVVSVDRRLTETIIVVRDQESGARIQTSLANGVTYLPGDIVQLSGNLEVPESFTSQNGRVFDYRRYLKSKGIDAVSKKPLITLIRTGSISLARIAAVLRFAIAALFTTYVTFPVDGIIAGMAVGYQGGIPSGIQDLFRSTGVLHVLVLSGYNVTLLAGFLGILFRGISAKVRSVCIGCAVVLLVLISGSGVASVRAGVMGLIALFAPLASKRYQPFGALVLSYIAFFIFSPLTIFFDPGFHLSFLATAYMILVVPKVALLFRVVPKTPVVDMRELVMLALSVPLFMLPYSMYFSGNFPLAAPAANALFAVLGTPLLVCAMLVLAFSWCTPLATMFGITVSFVGERMLTILSWLNNLPVWNTPTMSWWVVLCVYVLIGCGLFRREVTAHFLQLRTYLRQTSSSSDS